MKGYYTKKEVARKLGITTRALEKRIRNKVFPEADGEMQNRSTNGGGTKLKMWSKRIVDNHTAKPLINRENLSSYDLANKLLNKTIKV